MLSKKVAAVAAIVSLAGVSGAWADDSGHANPNDLKSEQGAEKGMAGHTTINTTRGDAKTNPAVSGAPAGANSGGMTGTAPSGQ